MFTLEKIEQQLTKTQDTPFVIDNIQYYVDDSSGLTERQVKELLSTRYPEYEFVKEVPFHQGARWFGNKKGSEY